MYGSDWEWQWATTTSTPNKPDAVVTKTEVVEKTVLVNERGSAISTYEGISKTKLAKRYGMKKASDVVNWLKSIGKEDVLKPGLTAAPCHYIPWEEVAELDRLWATHSGSRQILIGERLQLQPAVLMVVNVFKLTTDFIRADKQLNKARG